MNYYKINDKGESEQGIYAPYPMVKVIFFKIQVIKHNHISRISKLNKLLIEYGKFVTSSKQYKIQNDIQ